MSAGRRRPLVPFAVVLVLLSTLLSTSVSSAAEASSLRLFVADSDITARRGGGRVVYVDPGAWLTPVGGDFELRVTRPDYDTPVTINQVDTATGEIVRTLPATMLDGWFGLGRFGSYQVVEADGDVVVDETFSLCLNSFGRQRISDDGPLTSGYPYFCGGGPFTRGSIWGVEEGWASPFVGGYYYGINWRGREDEYTIRFRIEPQWVEALQIAPEDASADVHVTVVGRHGRHVAAAVDELPAPTYRPYGATPIVTNPDPASLPDLIPTPGWGMSVFKRGGREYLGFNATEWNAGPGTMVVEGFRGPNEDAMDAFQYFLIDGEAVGRAPVGQLEYHSGGGHNHWHFEEFTQYSLLDASLNRVLLSGKQSWCLVNTDAIDLTLPNANMLGYGGDLVTSCGGPGALWIREILDVGWGDTYSQYVRGQAFDITDVPNGRYYVRVHVNPTGSILETDQSNNIEDRLIRLKGKPGHRRVVVPPWHGIDA